MRNLIILLGLFLAACGSGGETETVPRAASITCNTAYRSGVSTPIEREESLSFGDEDAQQTINFRDLAFHAQYFSGELNHERALRLWVTETGETAELISQLYQLQLESGPVDQFIGGHGFTGLNYVYHPETGAELQFWCIAHV
jgi:hypothetical protein